MSEPTSEDDFGERWEHAAEKLRREHSLDGFLQMHEGGEVSRLELFSLAYEHWHQNPEFRDLFLSSLANHSREDVRQLSCELSAFVAKHR